MLSIVVPTFAYVVYLDGIEPVCEFGPGGKCTRKGQPIGTVVVPTSANMIYLDGLEPVSECGPGQEDNGPEENSPKIWCPPLPIP